LIAATLPMVEISFIKRISETLRMGTSLSFAQDEGKWQSMWTCAYAYEFYHCTVKGSVTNMSEIGATLEEKTSELMAISFSGKINYSTNTYKFGFGLSLSV